MAKTVIFLCRSCGQRLRAPRDRAGDRARCPKCGGRLSVPDTAGPGIREYLNDWRNWLSGPSMVQPGFGPGFDARSVAWNLRRRPPKLVLVAIGIGLAVSALVLLRKSSRPAESIPVAQKSEDPEKVALEAGTRFTEAPIIARLAPSLTEIPVPDFPGAMAVWGSSGVDRSGHIWFGVSAIDGKDGRKEPIPNLTARLFEFRPVSGQVVDRGDPISELKKAGLLKDGERQRKIDTRIVEAPDGDLYFASGDEAGAEAMDGVTPPKWGSHLWRLEPSSGRWEHLLATQEHLIAIACGGRHIFALGWPGHVLHAFDTKTGSTRSVRVGSVGGHISRNLLADHRGHVYAPRLRQPGSESASPSATLVEFDHHLRELGESPLEHYLGAGPRKSHGITGVQAMADRSIAFVTTEGYLYQVTPRESGPAELAGLGWFDPKGTSYVASLFTYDGVRHLVGVGELDGAKRWLVFDLATLSATAAPLPPRGRRLGLGEDLSSDLADGVTLYGCMTRDDRGNFYLVGRRRDTPLVVQAQPPLKVENLTPKGSRNRPSPTQEGRQGVAVP